MVPDTGVGAPHRDPPDTYKKCRVISSSQADVQHWHFVLVLDLHSYYFQTWLHCRNQVSITALISPNFLPYISSGTILNNLNISWNNLIN